MNRLFYVTFLIMFVHLNNFGNVISAQEMETSHSMQIKDVSLIALIANPKEFDGSLVRITGYVKLEFEGNSIYLSESDADNWITKNGLWLDGVDVTTYPKYNKKYCLIEGTFNSNNKGHMGLWSGAIENIKRFEVAWTDK